VNQPEKPDTKSGMTRLFETGLFLFTGEELKMRESHALPASGVVYEGKGPKVKHFEPRTAVNDEG
jgi:hypothetical protein